MKKAFCLIFAVLLIAGTVCACINAPSPADAETDPIPTSDNAEVNETDMVTSVPEETPAFTDVPVQTNTPEPAETITGDDDHFPADAQDSTRYSIAALNGSVSIPAGYHVFSEDRPVTDEMCRDIDVDPSNMRYAIALLQGQTLVIPAGEPYATSKPHIYIKVKDKKYEDITLSELSEYEYQLIASTIVSSFGVNEYSTVEGNGLRYFVFTANQGTGNVLRYATILNGHMVYIYANSDDKLFTAEEQSVIEYIALSVQHGL